MFLRHLLSISIGIGSMLGAAYAAALIQDTIQAAKYFEESLNFHTNPYGVKSIQNGKIKGKEKEVKAVIIDVRDEKSYKEGHIPGAINLPWDKFDSFNSAETEYPALIKDGYNIVYCYTGDCNLSQKACQKFAFLGYPVKEMIGGFESWKNHNYPIEK